MLFYLPTSQIFDYEKTARYMNMVDMHTLKDIVLEKVIEKIFNNPKHFNYYEELKDLKRLNLMQQMLIVKT